jgi:flavin reductase (DIM6/NTAB) family NADH-FMN oxidoreductase RutF/DNA-binding MarR family transcriptional regulator
MNQSSAAAARAAGQASEPIEAGDPALDSRAFRRCLGQFPTGVTVVAARNGERLVGMAVNSFAAVSLDPALVLWSIRRESGSVADFVQAGHYAVSVLSDEQVELSQLFGSGHPERFERARWQASRHGDPLFEGALAHFECRLAQVIEAGDHLILLGQVEHYARYEGSPLLFSQGAYGITQELPAPTASQAAAGTPSAAGRSDPELLRELIHASQRLSHDFDSHRQALGLTIPTARLLNSLLDGASCVEELAASTFLEQDEIGDGLAVLDQLGLVSSDAGQLRLTAAGRERRAEIASRADGYMRERLKGLADADIAAFRRVLQVLQN